VLIFALLSLRTPETKKMQKNNTNTDPNPMLPLTVTLTPQSTKV